MGELATHLQSELQNKIAFVLPIGDGVPVPDSALVSWIIMAAVLLAVFLMTRRLRVDRPGKVQVALETAVGFCNRFCQENMGDRWRAYSPWIGTVAIYLACANLIGLFGLTPPTKDLNVTAGLALTSVVLIYGSQFRARGFGGGVRKFAEPMLLMTPINLLEIGIRPLSLCMRLFGNVLGSFVIMELIKLIVPVFVPLVFSLYFDVFDGLIQTVVFVFLTVLFTKEAVE